MRHLMLLLVVALVASCDTTPRNYPQRAALHYSGIDSWDEPVLKNVSRAGLVILPDDIVTSPRYADKMAQLRSFNPSMKIIGYHLLMQDVVIRADTSYMRRWRPLTLDLHYARRPHWAFSTTGDTLMQWPDTPLLNPCAGDALNAQAITDIINVLKRYPCDGVLLDYFAKSPMLIRPRVVGEIDFNGNGVLWAQDASERAMYWQWQALFVQALRDTFGPDFIIVGNGRPAQEDYSIARWLNGAKFEDYPRSPWGWSEFDGFSRMMYCQRDGWFAPAHGRTWSVLANWRYGYAERLMYHSMLAGCFYADNLNVYKFTGWHADVDCGNAVRAAGYVSSGDTITVNRQFEKGTAFVRFVGGAEVNRGWIAGNK